MKIRMNYVSNSSSSSFVILGNKINNPLKLMNEGKNIIVHIKNCGTSGDVGDWCIPLTPEIYDIINHHSWFNHCEKPEYYELAQGTEIVFDKTINDYRLIVNENVSDAELICFQKDYTSPDNIDELKSFLKKEG